MISPNNSILSDLPNTSDLARMDQYVNVPMWRRGGFLITLSVATLSIVLISFFWTAYRNTKVPRLQPSEYSFRDVQKGVFDDKIKFDASVKPGSELAIVASVSGTVLDLHTNDGKIVDANSLVVTLTNTDFSRKMLSDRQAILDRLAQLERTELDAKKSILAENTSINALGFEVIKAKREYAEAKHLYELDLVSISALERADEIKEFQLKRIDAARENLKLEEQQFKQFSITSTQTRKNYKDQLKLLESVEDNLSISAPIGGRLTGLNLVVGQQVSAGERIALVEGNGTPVLESQVDEYYLEEISVGTNGKAIFGGVDYEVTVERIDPTVLDGTFKLELAFAKPPQIELRTGQSVSVELYLESVQDIVFISRNAYESLPNKRDVYIMDKSGDYANRRNVSFGRKSNDQVEVKEGLDVNQKFLTSYPENINKDRLRLR